MPKTYQVRIESEYPHRIEEDFTAIYDRQGYLIGSVLDVVEEED